MILLKFNRDQKMYLSHVILKGPMGQTGRCVTPELYILQLPNNIIT